MSQFISIIINLIPPTGFSGTLAVISIHDQSIHFSHIFPTIKTSFPTGLFHEILGRPCLRDPSAFDSNAILSADAVGFLRVRLMQFYFLLFVWSAVGC